MCGKTPHRRPSRTRRTAEVDHGRLGRTLSGKRHGFMQLLSLKNRFRARFPSKHHRQLLHKDHLQSIYSAGTILKLQIIKEFHRQLIHQHHLQFYLFCGNDPTITNHNEILSTAKTRNTGGTPLQCGTDPKMIRA